MSVPEPPKSVSPGLPIFPGLPLPDAIPLFPLPNVVHFPGVGLPLHIFENRFREMVRDALEGDRLIGMVLLRPGWEDQYEGRPPVYETGTAATRRYPGVNVNHLHDDRARDRFSGMPVYNGTPCQIEAISP